MCANYNQDAEVISQLHFDAEIDDMYAVLRKEFDFIQTEEIRAKERIETKFQVRKKKLSKKK